MNDKTKSELDTIADEASDLRELVRCFSDALYKKLLESERKYGWNGGWKSDDWANDLRKRIREHVEKGDPRDVAAYCAFAWHHGWSLTDIKERTRCAIANVESASEPQEQQRSRCVCDYKPIPIDEVCEYCGKESAPESDRHQLACPVCGNEDIDHDSAVCVAGLRESALESPAP